MFANDFILRARRVQRAAVGPQCVYEGWKAVRILSDNVHTLPLPSIFWDHLKSTLLSLDFMTKDSCILARSFRMRPGQSFSGGFCDIPNERYFSKVSFRITLQKSF